MSRPLVPGALLRVGADLWVVDRTQPVAAVVDPRAGGLLDVVAWTALPPPPTGEQWPEPVHLSDGEAVWAQSVRGGPVVRVDRSGITVGHGSEELCLLACGGGAAWCGRPPEQELVVGADGRPAEPGGTPLLLRLGADGSATRVWLPARLRALHAQPRGLVVVVDGEGWQRHHLGVDTYEVVRTTRQLLLPWGADELVADDGPVEDEERSWRPTWLRDPVHRTGSTTWRIGWSSDRTGGAWRTVLATVHDGEDVELLRRWDLGAGLVTSALPHAGGLAVALARQRYTSTERGPVDLLLLHPDEASPRPLLDCSTVDVAGLGWPLGPKPVEASTHVRRALAVLDDLDAAWVDEDDRTLPLVEGMTDGRTRLVGDWPDTAVEWTFRHPRRPGLLLRRRVPLFDELGRAELPEYASIHLMEDVDTGHLPSPEHAVDGVLDV